MTVTLASRSVPQPAPRLPVQRLVHSRLDPRAKSQQEDGLREQLQHEAQRHGQAAKLAAAQGDIEASARSILAMLNCERRLTSSGPQVMQVIKPRG
jgi:hypothetical protein